MTDDLNRWCLLLWLNGGSGRQRRCRRVSILCNCFLFLALEFRSQFCIGRISRMRDDNGGVCFIQIMYMAMSILYLYLKVGRK